MDFGYQDVALPSYQYPCVEVVAKILLWKWLQRASSSRDRGSISHGQMEGVRGEYNLLTTSHGTTDAM